MIQKYTKLILKKQKKIFFSVLSLIAVFAFSTVASAQNTQFQLESKE